MVCGAQTYDGDVTPARGGSRAYKTARCEDFLACAQRRYPDRQIRLDGTPAPVGYEGPTYAGTPEALRLFEPAPEPMPGQTRMEEA